MKAENAPVFYCDDIVSDLRTILLFYNNDMKHYNFEIKHLYK